jgi:hypothetical protein
MKRQNTFMVHCELRFQLVTLGLLFFCDAWNTADVRVVRFLYLVEQLRQLLLFHQLRPR